MKDRINQQENQNFKMSRIRNFFYSLTAVLSSCRFWTVQCILMLLIDSAVIVNFVFANHSLYDGFNYFWFNFGLFFLAVIIVNATTCAILYRCNNGLHFLGYLLMNYFIATLPCSVIQMIVYSNFNAQGFLNIEGGLIAWFLIFAVISSFFYRYLYDKQTSNFKYPAILSKTGRYFSVLSIILSVVTFALLVRYSLILDNLERWDPLLTPESELSYSVADNREAQFISDVRNRVPKHNEAISIYVDFSQSSAKKRFVVYDNRKKQVIAISKCAHGAGKGSTVDYPVFSNEVGSNCSSLGEYRVAELGKMANGFPCLRIDGLSNTNSNARKRGVVIHELPIFTGSLFDDMKIPLNEYISSGCFAIAPEVFELLTDLRKEGKTMYIYANN